MKLFASLLKHWNLCEHIPGINAIGEAAKRLTIAETSGVLDMVVHPSYSRCWEKAQ
jgi:hypothetical protein